MFSPVPARFWSSVLAGASIEDGARFSLTVDAALPDSRSVMIATSPDGGRVRAVLSAARARELGLEDVEKIARASEAQVRRLLSAAGIAPADPDLIHYLPEALLRGPASAVHTPDNAARALTDADAAAFAELLDACPEADRAEAQVELDHWAVVGVEAGGRLVAVATAYPWSEEPPVADLGVLTRPGARGRGFGRRATLALCREVLARGYEPQYRCDPANEASAAVARAAGFVLYQAWECIDDGD